MFSLYGTEFLLSSAYHPETDGQTEVVNRCIETYLRCATSDGSREWCKYLPMAEWWYNTHYHTTAGMTPYEAVYCQKPPVHLPYLPRESSNEVIDRSMQKREQILKTLKANLTKAQQRMKVHADKKRSERSFTVGDWVWLKLQQYRQQSVQYRNNNKLAAKYFGPFQGIAAVGKVAKLQLPSSARIHNVFHVSQLKRFQGELPAVATIPEELDKPPAPVQVPLAIHDSRIVQVSGSNHIQLLILWQDKPKHEATWINKVDFLAQFPGSAHLLT